MQRKHSGCEPVLKVRSYRDGEADTVRYINDLLMVTEFPPDFAAALNEIPDVLDGVVFDGRRSRVVLQCDMAQTAFIHAGS